MSAANTEVAGQIHPGASADIPEARQYSRIRRWISFADTSLGIAFLVVLLATGWTRNLRDFAFRFSHENYALALFFYVLSLTLIGKAVSLGLDTYSFRLEHRFHLSNQTTAGWIADEIKEWAVGLVLGTLLAELVYWIIRSAANYWWLIAWLAFTALFVVFAQLSDHLLTLTSQLRQLLLPLLVARGPPLELRPCLLQLRPQSPQRVVVGRAL